MTGTDRELREILVWMFNSTHEQRSFEWVVNEAYRRIRALSQSPHPSVTIDTAMVERSAQAVRDEWIKMIHELHKSAADIARDFVSPTNHRLVRACLTAALTPEGK